MNLRETAVWLRTLQTRNKAVSTHLCQVADWMEKGSEISLAEASVEDLFKEVAHRVSGAVLVTSFEIRAQERTAVMHAGSISSSIGLVEIAKNYLASRMGSVIQR